MCSSPFDIILTGKTIAWRTFVHNLFFEADDWFLFLCNFQKPGHVPVLADSMTTYYVPLAKTQFYIGGHGLCLEIWAFYVFDSGICDL